MEIGKRREMGTIQLPPGFQTGEMVFQLSIQSRGLTGTGNPGSAQRSTIWNEMVAKVMSSFVA